MKKLNQMSANERAEAEVEKKELSDENGNRNELL